MTDTRIIGTWRLKSTLGIDDTGNALPPPYGPIPGGVVCFEPSGRMYCVLCDGRTDLSPGEARQFVSYAGNFTYDGTTLSTRVDASSDPGRIGGDQQGDKPGLPRNYHRLAIILAAMPYSVNAKTIRSCLTGIRCDKLAPSGAVSMLGTTIIANAGR